MNRRRNTLAMIDTRDEYVRDLLGPLFADLGFEDSEDRIEIPVEDNLSSDLEVELTDRKQRWEEETE